MRFVSVRDFRSRSAEIWRDLAREGELVITSRGRPIAIISAVSEGNVESSLVALRRARAMAAVAELQQRSVREGLDRIPLGEINREIAVARKKRAR
jgi:antitoxin (DNA-binding transcriptional repressor) of toxin-antitoxin stability system